MPLQTWIPWSRKMTILAALIALVATVYAFGATTPQDLHQDQRRRRPHWHPAIRRRFQRRWLHSHQKQLHRRLTPGGRRPRQHEHHWNRSPDLLAEGRQGGQQLRGLLRRLMGR